MVFLLDGVALQLAQSMPVVHDCAPAGIVSIEAACLPLFHE
jgi:hypothetical protein